MTDYSLPGRSRVVEDVRAFLDAGRSVLLVGPRGAGKTAITTPRAAALRRALDRGTLVLGAASSLDPAVVGHVGRVAWRFERVYVRLRGIIRRQLDLEAAAELALDRRWMSAAVEVAAGLPGRAVALASVVAARWRERGLVLPPRLALVVAWQDGVAGSSDRLNATGHRPGESSS